MAVMSPRPLISGHEQKASPAAPTPASAGAGSMASDEAVVGMDLDTHGTTKNESSSDVASPKEVFDVNGARSPFVNGTSKGVDAPPSPPIPTPPLQTSNDSNAHNLSDLHITSPDGSFIPANDSMDTQMGGTESNGAGLDAESGSGQEPRNSRSTGGAAQEEDKPMSDMSADTTRQTAPKNAREREDDEDQDRPPKRAKTEDAPEPPPGTASTSTSTELSGAMTSARHKFLVTYMRSLRRTKDARPFTLPVDTAKYNIPHYHEIIKHPMDLQTMEKKLLGQEYPNVESFVGDFELIISNCITFNGPDHAITASGRAMKEQFYHQLASLPSEDVVEVEKPKSKKKGATTTTNVTPAPKAPVVVASKSGGKSKKKDTKSTVQSPAATSPVFSLQPSGVPQIRRDSTAGDGRPKREIHPPAPKDLPYSTKPRRKQNAAELKFCESVVKELFKKTHRDYAFPFYTPVDPVALNIPDYFKIIKRPMDMSTIQDKLKMNSYEDASEFEADVRLMFNNCYKFNPESQTVHQMGRKLEAVFDQKWKEKPLYTANQGSRSPQSVSPAPQDEEDLSEDEDDNHSSNIAELEKKLEAMKQELSLMKKKKTPPAQGESKKGKSHNRKGSVAGPSKKSTKRRDSTPYITLEQKTELSERINYLPPNRMKRALGMIKENMPEIGSDGGEIELDIDELDPATLYRLYQFVSKHAPPVPTQYIPPPPPPPANESKVSKKAASSKARKNKPMSAAEQEAKIQDLQSRLQSFNNGTVPHIAVTQPAHADESSDDEGDDTDSESSEEE